MMKARGQVAPVRRIAPLQRWLIFNFVGALGIVVQVTSLMLLTRWKACDYMLATAAAVEAAVIHNFLWHERWTWADRDLRVASARLFRFFRFQLTNGVAPLIGNLVLTRFFFENFQLSLIPSNLMAIALCSIFTFFASDLLVFSRPIRSQLGQRKSLIR